jgi:hypothetical protein
MPQFHSLVPGGFFGDGKTGPVSIRANNPGAINGAAWEKSYPGLVGNVKYDGVNDTTVFEAPEYGVAAWWELLRRYREGGTTTVAGIIARYGGGQDYASYARTVSQWSGLDPNFEIRLSGDDDNLLRFAKAMFRFEAGQPTPLSNAQIRYGFVIGRNGGKLPAAPPNVGAAFKPAPATDAALARRIVAAMEHIGAQVDRGEGELNIVYVEGMNLDGTPNDNAIDKWNDLRCVVGFDRSGVKDARGRADAGIPVLMFKCDATTEPGLYYDRIQPIGGPKGAALIALGQQRCWQVGIHHPGGPQEALVQTGAAVSIYRDYDRSFRRQAGHISTGWYGINQHGTREGSDGAPSSIGRWSAGCLVARRFADHKAFMALVKSDPRYRADHQYVFATTVLSAEDVLEAAAPQVEAPPSPPRRDLVAGGGIVAAIAALVHLLGAHPIITVAAAALAAAGVVAFINWMHR